MTSSQDKTVFTLFGKPYKSTNEMKADILKLMDNSAFAWESAARCDEAARKAKQAAGDRESDEVKHWKKAASVWKSKAEKYDKGIAEMERASVEIGGE